MIQQTPTTKNNEINQMVQTFLIGIKQELKEEMKNSVHVVKEIKEPPSSTDMYNKLREVVHHVPFCS